MKYKYCKILRLLPIGIGHYLFLQKQQYFWTLFCNSAGISSASNTRLWVHFPEETVMYTCIKVSTKCINSLQRSSISSLEKKCRDRSYSKAKTLYFEVTDDSLIKLVFHPLSSETRKVRKGFDSAGNGKKKNLCPQIQTRLTGVLLSHACTHLQTVSQKKTWQRGAPSAPTTAHRLNTLSLTAAVVPSFRLNPPRSPTLRSSELICAKQPNIRKVCWKVSAHVSN